MLEIIMTKIILGISLAAPIGPVNAEMIKRGLVSGFWGSFSVRLGGAVANSICLLVAYFGLGKLIQHPIILLIVSLIGEIIIIYMGTSTIIRSMSKNFMSSIDNRVSLEVNQTKKHYSIRNGLMVGMALAFTSPVGLMFWLGTFAATMQQEATTKVCLYNLLINFFIIAGVLIWGAFVSLILHFGSKIIDQKKLRIVSALSGLILIYFGVKYGINSFNNFKNLFL